MTTKKTDPMLKDYVVRLGQDVLYYLSDRLKVRLNADLYEAVDLLSQNPEMDRYLAGAETADQFYDCLDKVQEYVDREIWKRAPQLRSA